ncbi:hypothetical protein AN1V17_51550 [Vallitalea sediminicola]
MNILFIYSNKDDPCTRKCSFELSKGLRKLGESSSEIYYKEINEDILKKNDIIIFQRLGANGILISQKDEEVIIQLIRKYYDSKKFIYMIDDLVIEEQNGLPKKFLKECHAAICYNEPMKQNISLYSKKTYVLRTFVDMDVIKNIRKNDYNGFYISWVSTGAIGKKLILNIINRINQERLNIKFITMSGSSFLSGVENVNSHRYVPFSKMIYLLNGTQILLNPVTIQDKYYKEKMEKRTKKSINHFLNCKTEIKYALAGATRNAIISSKTAPFLYAINNKKNGVLVNDTVEEWVNAIKQLYENDKLREQMIINAYNDVNEHYNLEYAAKKIVEIFKDVLAL